MNRKRTGSDGKPIDVKRPRKECSYGESCFRKNPYHFKEFKHSHLEQILAEYSGSGEYDIPPSLSFQSKLVSEQLDILRENNISPANENTADRQKPLESKPVNSVPEQKNDLNVLKNASQSNDRSSSLNLEKKTPKNQSKMAENGASSRSSGDAGSQAPGPSAGRRIEDYFNVVLPRGKMAEKHKKAAPFYIFHTTITASPQTHNQPLSITFQELLDKSLGELHSSLQINFMIDIGWLLAHYYFAGYSNKPLTILYGEDTPDIKMISSKKNNVQAHCVQMGSPFGKHHTKMSVLCYEDHSVRIVVSTANLYIDDWENRTQGLWLSPRCPPLPDGSMPHDGESATGFKASIINYLSSYRLSSVSPFIERIKNADFTIINVFFVASVPGGHTSPNWGMTRMGALLTKYCRISDADRSKWDLIVQSSSIGSFGKEPKLWLTGDFLKQFSRCANQGVMQSGLPALKLIYPSLENVQGSHDGLLGGGCLPYGASAHTKQTWLLDFLHQWKAVGWHRDRAMPHIKSYLRLSPCRKKAAFYHLTSANVSKAAWGTINKGNAALRIMSYEVGVLFLPEFVVKKDHFSLDTSDALCLPVPYDLPPIPYSSGMSPWVMDYLHS